MIGFLLKKNFCDGWDNLLSLVVTNILFLFVGMGLVYVNFVCASYSVVFIIVFAISCVILSILYFAYGDVAANIENFKGVRVVDYFKAIPGVLKDASLFGLLIAVICVLSFFSFNFYFLQSKSMFTFFVGALLVWVDVFIILSLQWFVPIRSLMHNDFRKCLKKCFIIFFDNTGYSVFMGFYNLIMIALSVVLVGFMPSIAGIQVATTNALRLRLYKYDYLEKHPEFTTKKERKNIPWEELIYEDRETLGPRSWKSFLFPWKDQ